MYLDNGECSLLYHLHDGIPLLYGQMLPESWQKKIDFAQSMRQENCQHVATKVQDGGPTYRHATCVHQLVMVPPYNDKLQIYLLLDDGGTPLDC